MEDVTPRSGWLPAWFRSWAADSVALLFSQFAAVAATSALAILLARHLGPRDWGIFSGFLGLSLAVSVLVEFGLTPWLLRELSQLWAGEGETALASDAARRSAGQIVMASLAVNLALGATMIVGAVAATGIFRLGTASAFLLISLVAYGGLSAASYGLEAVFRARRRLSQVVIGTLLEKGLLLLLVIVFVLLRFGMVAIGVAYLLAGVAHAAFDVAMIVRGRDIALLRPSRGTARYVLRESLPFALIRASLNIIPLLDTLILAALSAVAAGYFALGARALGPIIIIPVVMSTALYPFLARESKDSRAGLKVVAMLGAAGAVIGAIGIVLAPPLVPLVFGANYKHAIGVVQVMMLALPFIFAANPLLAHVYTARLEHRALGLGLGGVSCVGTGALVVGQLVSGPAGAAGGYVFRSALFVVVLAVPGGARTPRRSPGRTGLGGHRRVDGEASGESSPARSPGAPA